MATQKFKTGDTVEFFSRRNTPRRVGKVIWARGADPKGASQLWQELHPLCATNFTHAVGRPTRGYLVEVRGPFGGRMLFAPLEANMTLAQGTPELKEPHQ